MLQRGKKSVAALSVAGKRVDQRAKPPANLTPAEAVVWRATVATKPADWFQPDSYPMLTAYCRAVAMADRLTEMLATLPAATEDPTAFLMFDKLLAMRDREGKAINTYARAMRLTQQSRLKAETAATAHKRANGADGSAKVKPWDFA